MYYIPSIFKEAIVDPEPNDTANEFLTLETVEEYLKWPLNLTLWFDSCNVVIDPKSGIDKESYTRILVSEDDSLLTASRGIYAYQKPNEKYPRLLMLDLQERSATEFKMHGSVKSYTVTKSTIKMYALENETQNYRLVETRTFERAAFPKNQKIRLFELNSPFGKLYAAFMKECGVADENIHIPSMAFLEE